MHIKCWLENQCYLFVHFNESMEFIYLIKSKNSSKNTILNIEYWILNGIENNKVGNENWAKFKSQDYFKIKLKIICD